jgi:hypothetical protein
MLYLGDFKAAKTIDFAFDTEVNGLPSTLSAATVKVYKNSSSTTEVTTGVTHTEDFDALTGLNHITIDLSSDGAFYAAGNEYAVILTQGTLGGATIRRTLAMFSIENRVVNWAQVGSPTTALALTGTTISTAQVAASVTAGVTVTTNNDKTGYGLSAAAVQAIWDALTSALTTVGSIGKRIADFLTGDAYVRLGAPAGASVSVDVAAIKVDTAAVKVQTDKLAFTVANQIDANVIDWKGAAAPAMTGDAFARLGAPAGASVSADVAAINTKTTNLPAAPAAVGSAMTLTSGERDSVADAHLDRAAAIETGLTPRQALRLISAAEGGKVSGAATTTVVIRNAVADSKPRITATVDANGNRSAVVTDVT